MSKLTEEYLETTMEDDNGGEIDIRVYYHYQKYEAPTLEYSGCFAEVTVESVGVDTQYNLDEWAWYGFYDYEESQATDWEEEIMTLINAKDNDDE